MDEFKAFKKMLEGSPSDRPTFKNRKEALDYWRKEAFDLTEYERNRDMEDTYHYSLRVAKLWPKFKEHPNCPNRIDILEGQESLSEAKKAITKAAEALSRRNVRLAVCYFESQMDKYVQILELKTTFEVSVYSIDESAENLPRNEDDFVETEDCFVCAEYDDRNDFLEGYMAFLTWGARYSHGFKNLGIEHWIRAIRKLKQTSDQRSGQGMSLEDAKEIFVETREAIKDLALVVHLTADCPEGASPITVNDEFFIAEEGLMGISAIRFREHPPCEVLNEESMDEEWIIYHNHQVIGGRIEINYSAEEGLSLRDVVRCPKPEGTQFNYRSLCKAKYKGKRDQRFHIITLLLMALGEGSKNTCQSKGEEWSKCFQAPKSDDPENGRKATAYRFKVEQLEPLKDKKGVYNGEWRFKTKAEITRQRIKGVFKHK